MEKIINFKMKDFLRQNTELVIEYMNILEHLKPVLEINNPRWTKKSSEPKTIKIIPVRELSFGEVSLLRDYFQMGNEEAIFESLSLVTKLNTVDILNLGIIDFYGVIASIKNDLINISMMEANELADDTFDYNIEVVGANERLAKFGVFNAINSLAGDDITKWDIIEKLPYMTVFTKLVMDKEKYNIQKELDELQRKKQG